MTTDERLVQHEMNLFLVLSEATLRLDDDDDNDDDDADHEVIVNTNFDVGLLGICVERRAVPS